MIITGTEKKDIKSNDEKVFIVRCSTCSKKNRSDFKFCVNCGQSLNVVIKNESERRLEEKHIKQSSISKDTEEGEYVADEEAVDGDCEEEKDSMAKWSFGLGLTSIFFASIGIVPLLAIILGVIGIIRTKEEGTGRWMAVTGLILGVVFFISNMNMNGHLMSSYEKCIEENRGNDKFYSQFSANSDCGHLK